MVPTSIVTARIDDQVKKQAAEILGNIGLDMSGAINIFFRAIVRERGIPFVLAEEPDEEYRAHILKTLAERKELAKDPNTRWYSTDEMREMFGIEKA
jgi:DNA-damage-inducible protein J